ncbi:MAG: hypothetical protein ACMG6E_03000 [Candidatus Roizmanbacteria bacterium]
MLLINALFGDPPGDALFCLLSVLIECCLLSSYFYVDTFTGLLLGEMALIVALSFSMIYTFCTNLLYIYISFALLLL